MCVCVTYTQPGVHFNDENKYFDKSPTHILLILGGLGWEIFTTLFLHAAATRRSNPAGIQRAGPVARLTFSVNLHLLVQ